VFVEEDDVDVLRTGQFDGVGGEVSAGGDEDALHLVGGDGEAFVARLDEEALALLAETGAEGVDDQLHGQTSRTGGGLKTPIPTTTCTCVQKIRGKNLRLRRDLPQPPAVDLILELRNTSDKDLHVCLRKGDYGLIHGLTLEWKSPGALKVSFANARGVQVPPTIVDVPAGKTHKVALARLEASDGRTYRAVYWTQAGEYTLVLGWGERRAGPRLEALGQPVRLRRGPVAKWQSPDPPTASKASKGVTAPADFANGRPRDGKVRPVGQEAGCVGPVSQPLPEPTRRCLRAEEFSC
jgi:hypothetical protein